MIVLMLLNDDAEIMTAFRPNEHVAGKIMDGELVVISLETGLYYSSTGVGSAIWQLMEAGYADTAIVDVMVRHFGATQDRVQTDVSSFLDKLLAQGLIEPVADPGPAAAVEISFTGAYETPAFTSFDDMQEAFALDPPLGA